jgi:hypothetical protein
MRARYPQANMNPLSRQAAVTLLSTLLMYVVSCMISVSHSSCTRVAHRYSDPVAQSPETQNEQHMISGGKRSAVLSMADRRDYNTDLASTSPGEG